MAEKRNKKTQIIFTFLLISVFSFAGPQLSGGISKKSSHKHFMWKVGSASSTVYVLGSVHFLKKDNYPLAPVIEKAFEKSDILAVEADVNDISDLDIGKLLENSMYSGQDRLERHISLETYTLLKKRLAETGIPVGIIAMQKPWFAAMTITALGLLRSGLDPENGIDKHFLSRASGRKKIVELEGLHYQVDLLSSLSDREQEAFLLNTLHELENVAKETDDLLRAWTAGDAAGLESLILKSVVKNGQTGSVYEKLLYRRNRNMAARITEFLATGNTYFVVVGAGHLVGEKGIIRILKDAGFGIEQM